jgi:hypothetical protein
VTPIRLGPGDLVGDVAESAVVVDAANGMRVLAIGKPKYVAVRITNTHASPHSVTIPAVQLAGNARAVYGAPGPAVPTEPDFVSVAIPATTGVRWLRIPSRYFRSDGSFWLNFEAAHTGTASAVELS